MSHSSPDNSAQVDRCAVADALARLAAAWNAGDVSGYAVQFTEDATYVAFNGEVMRGRAAIEDTHRFLFEGPLRYSRLTTGNDNVPADEARFVRPGVALVLSGGGVQPAGEPELDPDRESVAYLVLVGDGGAWQIAAFHNTRRQR